MKRTPPLLLAGLPIPVLALGLALVAGGHPPPEDPVYAVAAVRAHLEHDPRAWLGRTVRVQGIAIAGSAGCETWPSPESTSCRQWQGIVDAAGARLLPVGAGLDPLLGRLRGVPLLGAVVPAPQVLRWGTVATCRVRLRAIAGSICGTGVCYEAVLLDAAPRAE